MEQKTRSELRVQIMNILYQISIYKIKNITYSVDDVIKENIEIRYYAENKDNMWIYENGKKQEKVKKLDKVANSKIPRKNGIDYSKMINKEEDVIDLGEENEIS